MIRLKTYEAKDYLSEDGRYITTPLMDSCLEISLAVFFFLVSFSLGMVFVTF